MFDTNYSVVYRWPSEYTFHNVREVIPLICDHVFASKLWPECGHFWPNCGENMAKLRRSVIFCLCSNGAEWKQARSAVNKPMLRMKSIMDHFEDLNQVADDMVERLHKRERRNRCKGIDQELFRWSLECKYMCTILMVFWRVGRTEWKSLKSVSKNIVENFPS